MLGKLFKYDYKWINKIMYVYYIIIFIITISVKIIESLEQTILMVIVDKILSGMFIGCSISIIITTIMRVWSRYISNIYKDESYLTHTLPVTKNQIFNSKIISGVLSIFISSIVILICFSIIYINGTTIDMIKSMYQSLVQTYSSSFAVCFIIGLVVIIMLEMIYFLMAGIFGITLGYRSNSYKIIKSIVIGIGSYGFLSTISLIILSIMSEFADFKILTDGFPSANTIKVMGITGLVIYIVYDLLYYFVSKIIINKGVNVE